MNGNLAYQDESPMEWEEGPRMERINGKLVAMSPRPLVNHNRVSGNIFWIFETYLRGKRCEPFDDGTDLFLTEDENYIPDMMVVCDPEKIRSDGVYGAPDLVVEVLSPSTARYDRGHKKDVYGRCGVGEYWIVSPAEKMVEIYRNNGGDLVFYTSYTLYPDCLLKKMTEEERAKVETHFKCSLYEDLDISLEDVFYRTF